jgi:hypothetical protein
VLSNNATLDATYTTIADNDGKAGVEDSLDCVNPGAGHDAQLDRVRPERG